MSLSLRHPSFFLLLWLTMFFDTWLFCLHCHSCHLPSTLPPPITVGATLGSVAFTSVPRLLTSGAFTSCCFFLSVCLEKSSQNACSDNLRHRSNATFLPVFQVLRPQTHTALHSAQLPSEGQAPHALFGFIYILGSSPRLSFKKHRDIWLAYHSTPMHSRRSVSICYKKAWTSCEVFFTSVDFGVRSALAWRKGQTFLPLLFVHFIYLLYISKPQLRNMSSVLISFVLWNLTTMLCITIMV